MTALAPSRLKCDGYATRSWQGTKDGPIRLHVSDPARTALFDTAGNRQKSDPDNTVSYLAGRIIDEALRQHLDVED